MPSKTKKKTNKPLIVGSAVAITAAALPPLVLIGISQRNSNINGLEDQNDVEAIVNHFKTHNQSVIVNNPKWNKFNSKSIQTDDINNFSHEFGIKNPNNFRGTNVNYQIQNVDHDQGQINLKVNVSKNKISKNLEIQLRNFKKHNNSDEHEVDFAKYLIEKLLNNKTIKSNSEYKNILPSEFKIKFENGLKENDLKKTWLAIPQKVNNENEHIKDPDTGMIISHLADVKYNIIDFNNVYGKIKIEAQISKNNAFDKTIVELSGFKRSNEQNWTDVLEAIKIFQELNANIFIPQNSKFINVFPDLVQKTLERTVIEENLDNLGIILPNLEKLNNVQLKFKIKNSNNQNGILNFEVIFSKGIANQSINLSIKGFKSTNQEMKKQLDQSLTQIPSEQTTTKNDVLPSEIIKNNNSIITLDVLGLKWWDLKDLTPKNTKLKIIDFSDQKGEIIVELTLFKEQINVNKIIKINNFKNLENQISEEIENVKKLLINQSTNKNHLTTLEMIENLNLNITLTDLGLKEISDKNINGVTIWLQILEHNNTTGIIKVQATLSKGSLISKTTFEVSGFKTQTDQNQSDIQKALESIKDLESIKSYLLPSEITKKGELVNSKDLGIKSNDLAKHLGIKVEYLVVDLNDQDGWIKVNVKLSKGEITAEKIILISKFQTINIRDETLVKNTIKNIQTIVKDLEIFNLNQLPKKFENFIHNQKLKNDVNLNFEVIAFNNRLGQIEVKVKISKGKIEETTTIIISNFMTIEQENQTILKDLIDLIPDEMETSWKNTLPSQVENLTKNPSAKEIGIELNPKIFKKASASYEIKEINDEIGEISLKITLTKEETSVFKIIKITNYLTLKNKVNQELTDLKNILNKKYSNISLTINSEQRNVFPSQIFEQFKGQLNDETLKTFNIDKYKTYDWYLKIIYSLIGFDDESGTITIEIELEKKLVKQKLTFEVRNFETKNQNSVKKIIDFLEKNNKNIYVKPDYPKWKNKLPSEIQEELNQNLNFDNLIELNIKLPPKDLEISYQFNLIMPNDEAGTILLKITVMKNDVQKNTFILIKGFLTNFAYLNLVGIKIKDLNQGLKINNNSDDKNLLPSEVNRELKGLITNDMLKRFKIKTLTNLDEVTFSFRIFEHNNQAGKIGIEVEIKRNANKVKVPIYVSGFLKADLIPK